MRIYFVSLGCDKNLVDAEHMLSLLTVGGHTICDDEYEADVIIVNSCCFIKDALEESIDSILELAAMKEDGNCKALIVTGCMAQRFSDEIMQEIPEVDAIVGTNSFEDILKAIDSCMISDETYVSLKALDTIPQLTGRIMTTGGYFEYLKIAEGCDKYCSYCIIPYIRGSYRSVPMEMLLEETERMVADGVREICLVAQETTIYGTDLYGHNALPELIDKLSRIDDLRWIRILYCYPEEITDELIETIATNPKVCHYLDLPIQSGSDNVLKAMGRRTDAEAIRRVVAKLRDRIPDIALRTTMLCGFPGETEEDHQATLDLIGDLKFDRLGCFTYSREEGTRAAELDSQIDEDIKERRREEIMLLEQSIIFDRNESYIGEELDIIVEGRVVDEDNLYMGRSYRDAPSVDGMVFVHCDHELMSGDFIRVRITAAENYDLIGDIVDEFA